jgi:hypothetical protein
MVYLMQVAPGPSTQQYCASLDGKRYLALWFFLALFCEVCTGTNLPKNLSLSLDTARSSKHLLQRRNNVLWETSIETDTVSIPFGTTVTCKDAGCNITVSQTMNIEGTFMCIGNMCKINIIAQTLRIATNGSLRGGDINIAVSDMVHINGSLSAAGLGYVPSSGEGKGAAPPNISSSSFASTYYAVGGGAGHGGNGGKGCAYSGFSSSGAGGGSYGSARQPESFGSGGGSGCHTYLGGSSFCSAGYSVAGGAGGGRIRVNASTIVFRGGAVVNASGARGDAVVYTGYSLSGGAGSGGSIWLDARSIDGSGLIVANGGASMASSGAGGGGRIALYASAELSSRLVVQSMGGSSCGGAAGSVFMQQDAGANSTFVFDNQQVDAGSSGALTPYPKDLHGVAVRQVVITGTAAVLLSGSQVNNKISAGMLEIRSQARLTGDAISLVTNKTTVHGKMVTTGLCSISSDEVVVNGTVTGERLSVMTGNLTVYGKLNATSELTLIGPPGVSSSNASLLVGQSGSLSCPGCAMKVSLGNDGAARHRNGLAQWK